MAVIPIIGQPAPARLRTAVSDAGFAVAERLIHLDLASMARVHGSGATHEMTFIDSGSGPKCAGDLDLVLECSMSSSGQAALAAELTGVFRSVIAPYDCVASRVSIKTVDADFVATYEAPSLLASAALRGRSTWNVYMKPRDVARVRGAIAFPFAMQYATLNWLRHIGTGSTGNAIGAYELAKGVWRTVEPRTSCILQPRITAASECVAFLTSHLSVLNRTSHPAVFTAIARWLDAQDVDSATLPASMVAAARAAFTRSIARSAPRSLLVRRLPQWSVTRCA